MRDAEWDPGKPNSGDIRRGTSHRDLSFCASASGSPPICVQVLQQVDGAAGDLRPADGADDAESVTAERLREGVARSVCCGGLGARCREGTRLARQSGGHTQKHFAQGSCLFVRAHPDHRPSALRRENKLTALPESFGQLTALRTLGLSQRSACAILWRGPCVAVVLVRGA